MDADPPKPTPAPNRTAEVAAREAERRKRLAEALRANLRKRKERGSAEPT